MDTKTNSTGTTTSEQYRSAIEGEDTIFQKVLWDSRTKAIECKASAIHTTDSVSGKSRRSIVTPRLNVSNSGQKYDDKRMSQEQIKDEVEESQEETESDDIEHVQVGGNENEDDSDTDNFKDDLDEDSG